MFVPTYFKPHTEQSSLHTIAACPFCSDCHPEMSAGFGFSVGDFVTGINLLKNVIDALKDCGESTAEYRGLTKDLENLMTTLCQVQHLEFDESLLSERDALYKAASYVQGIIEQFLDKNQKFHDPLSIGGSGSRVRDAWKKVQWALCKKEDVAKFREQLRDCIGTINLLLATAQMYLLYSRMLPEQMLKRF